MPTRPKTDARGHGRRLLLLVQRQGPLQPPPLQHAPPTGRGSPGPDPLLRLRRARLPVPQGDDARSFTEQGCLSWWPEKGHADKRAKRPRQGRQARHIPIEHQVGLHPRRQVQRGRPPLRHPLVEFDRRAKDSSLWARTAGSWARTSWAACSCAAAASCSSSDSHKKKLKKEKIKKIKN